MEFIFQAPPNQAGHATDVLLANASAQVSCGAGLYEAKWLEVIPLFLPVLALISFLEIISMRNKIVLRAIYANAI
jgi:hypothetical protein